jgi:light-regulated signal transduction histidine kinase (bacteriophytochrome)
MTQFEDPTVSLSQIRDYTSIRSPGAIQPHGILFVLREPELTILQASHNTEERFGIAASELLDRSLNTLLEPLQIDAIQQCLSEDLGRLNPIQLSIANQSFHAIVHRTEAGAILELESIDPAKILTISPHTMAHKAIAKLKKTTAIPDFLQQVVTEVRAMTAFDRVHIYQFDHQGAGSVIAEAKREDLPSYLGLHYPAWDIPDESREFYRQGLMRFVPTVSATPVELVPSENPITGQPLDLSATILRSVDLCCVEYYQNLGSEAFFVIALIKAHRLWGLISCHHETPKSLSYDIRSACDLLGQFASLELANRIDHEEFNQLVRLKSLHSGLIQSISQIENLQEALIHPTLHLLEIVGAQGAALCLDQDIHLVGATPTESEVWDLIEWADTQVSDSLFQTHALPKLYPPAEAFKDTTSGLLLLKISQVRRYYILWFRPEVIQTVNWAGNPKASIDVNPDGSIAISPRSSFEKWQETVRFTSLPWQSYELDSALDLRNEIVGIVLKKADDLAHINLALERTNRELESFAYAASHDLKEPLRGIHNNAVILMEDYGNALDADGMDCLQTMVRLTQRMDTLVNTLLRFSQLGNIELHQQPIDFNQVVDRTIEMLKASRPNIPLEVRIPRSLPTINGDPVFINEVVSNLLSNAFKYNNKPQPWAEVGYLAGEELATVHPPRPLQESSKPFVLYIRDNGIGIRPHHLNLIFKLFKRLHAQEDYGGGAGAGLTITKKIIERHGGQLWVDSTYREGSTFYFYLE